MASFEKDVNNNFLKSAVSVSQIQEILNIPDGTSDESPDLLSIFGSFDFHASRSFLRNPDVNAVSMQP